MSGQKKDRPDRAEPGWRDYAGTENIGRRDGVDELDETEAQIRRDEDADGDGRREPSVGSSDFLSRDAKTELEKTRLRNKG